MDSSRRIDWCIPGPYWVDMAYRVEGMVSTTTRPNRRRRTFSVRLSVAEMDYLQEAAEGVSVGGFIRQCAMEKAEEVTGKPRPQPEDEPMPCQSCGSLPSVRP